MSIPHELNSIEAALARVEARQHLLLRLVALLIRNEKEISMSFQDELNRLTADITKNTDATASATSALTHYAASTADLTAQLKAALDAANVNEPAIKAAADALEANNAGLLAAVPQVATAIVAGTPAASA